MHVRKTEQLYEHVARSVLYIVSEYQPCQLRKSILAHVPCTKKLQRIQSHSHTSDCMPPRMQRLCRSIHVNATEIAGFSLFSSLFVSFSPILVSFVVFLVFFFFVSRWVLYRCICFCRSLRFLFDIIAVHLMCTVTPHSVPILETPFLFVRSSFLLCSIVSTRSLCFGPNWKTLFLVWIERDCLFHWSCNGHYRGIVFAGPEIDSVHEPNDIRWMPQEKYATWKSIVIRPDRLLCSYTEYIYLTG